MLYLVHQCPGIGHYITCLCKQKSINIRLKDNKQHNYLPFTQPWSQDLHFLCIHKVYLWTWGHLSTDLSSSVSLGPSRPPTHCLANASRQRHCRVRIFSLKNHKQSIFVKSLKKVQQLPFQNPVAALQAWMKQPIIICINTCLCTESY